MKTIYADAKTIQAIINEANTERPRFFAAVERAEFQGFAGGFDRIELAKNRWSAILVDRGLDRGGRYLDNTTRFSVPMSQRHGVARGSLTWG